MTNQPSMIISGDRIRTGGIAGMSVFPLIVLAAVSGELGSGDFREDAFLWLVAATAVVLMLYARGIWELAGPNKNRVLQVTATALFIGFLCLEETSAKSGNRVVP